MKKTLCFAIPAVVLLAVITVVVAYNNVGTHPTINGAVVDKFEARVNASTPASKFANYIFVFDGNAEFTGPAVTKPGNWDIEVKNESKTPKEWVEHGGYSADEPEVFAALRHFYDPLGMNGGKRYLTNRGTYWEGLAENPGIDAKSWAISDPENAWSWLNGIDYMKKALEEPDTKIRDGHMAKAYRCLGETMHLLADMGCPVHVRNDSHAPSMALGAMGDPDPYESYMVASVVTKKKDGPAEPNLKDAFGNATRAEDLLETLAVFTNENFFTNQTISGMGVEKINPIIDDQPAYPKPKLGGLEYIEEEFTFYKTFSSGAKVKICKDHSYFWFRGYPYIDSDCADSQAAVLIPNILEGGVHLMRLFIPQLKVEIEEIDSNEGYIRGTVTHTTDDEYVGTIYYNGPVDIFMDFDKIATVEADGGDFEGDIPAVPEGKEVSAEIHFGGITVRSEKKKPALTANWEMLLRFEDVDMEYYPANVIRIDDWMPVMVGADGRVSVDYSFADPRYLINLADTHTVTHHFKGSGTYLDNRLEIKGTWSTDAKWEYPSGSCIKTGFHRVNGSFTLAGKHSSGFFFNDSKTSKATAAVVWEEIQTCYDAEGEVTNTYKEDYNYSDLTPLVAVDEFQRK